MEAPKSYKDPFWLDLAAQKERKLGLPDGLLQGILTKGERSNNDQVSEAQARTVFQIIPATRDRALKKYGIDAYLSPNNAAEVAGLLLRESLDRNKGDVVAAVGEYHGGTDRANWGRRTRAYIDRVAGEQAQPEQSTFERVSQRMGASNAPQISAILGAYRTGKMTPEDAASFEADVMSGAIMLPSGQDLQGPAKQERGGNVVPDAVVQAYLTGQMTPEDMESFRQDVKAGLIDVPDGYGAYFEGSKAKSGSDLIPGVPAGAPSTPRTAPTIGDQAVGALEAVRAAVGGAVTTPLAAAGGLATGAVNAMTGGGETAEQAATRLAGEMMQPFTPETRMGQQYTEAVGKAAEILPPVIPLAQELGAAARGAQAAAPATRAAAAAAVPAAAQRVQRAVEPLQRAAQAVTAPVQRAVQSVRGEGGFAQGSVGAGELPAATVRRERAAQMPVPLEGEAALTRGQASRDFAQLQFEKETAKIGETGRPLRERAMNQNEVIQQNFDALVDVLNPQYLDKQAVGGAVDRALVNRANMVMKRVSEAYKAADEAGELEAPAQMNGFASALQSVEDFRPFLETEMNAIERQALRMGALVPDGEGGIQPGQITLRQSETLRQYINDSIDWTDKRQARVGRILKEGIDQSTEGAGGAAYARARGLYRQQVAELENAALTRKLLNTKRNSDERQIAIEDVYDRVIVRSSVEEMNKLRGSLLKAGDDGKQAWANLKAKAIDDIKEQGLMQATDERGNRVLSPAGLNKAIQRLDQSGKLEALYGKRQAQVIRDLGEISRDVMSAPPGAVNFSNTASALRVALDSVATFGVTGIPAPAATALKEATKYMREKQTRNRVREALSIPPNQQKSGKF